MKDYLLKTDEELCLLAQGKDTEAMDVLINRYRSMSVALARSYFLNDGDVDDLIQEGLIGVFKAIETFDGSSVFKTYVYSCIKNRILTAVKKSGRKKNLPLNNYISLSGLCDGDMDKSYLFIDNTADPEATYLKKETEKEFINKFSNLLSKLEIEVFKLYLQGYSYTYIAEKINKNNKTIDNALQRVKQKLSILINNGYLRS